MCGAIPITRMAICTTKATSLGGTCRCSIHEEDPDATKALLRLRRLASISTLASSARRAWAGAASYDQHAPQWGYVALSLGVPEHSSRVQRCMPCWRSDGALDMYTPFLMISRSESVYAAWTLTTRRFISGQRLA